MTHRCHARRRIFAAQIDCWPPFCGSQFPVLIATSPGITPLEWARSLTLMPTNVVHASKAKKPKGPALSRTICGAVEAGPKIILAPLSDIAAPSGAKRAARLTRDFASRATCYAFGRYGPDSVL